MATHPLRVQNREVGLVQAATNCLCAAPYQVPVDGVQQDDGGSECAQVPRTGGGGTYISVRALDLAEG